MEDQELEFHVQKLEQAFNSASAMTRRKMRPGIRAMIRSLKAAVQRVPLSLRRLERRMIQDDEEEFFNNMPV